MGDLFVDVVWHIISALPAARSRLADGQISFGPVSGPSTQWQFCRPQRLYVSTNVPRRTCSIGGKSRTIGGDVCAARGKKDSECPSDRITCLSE